MSPLEQYRAFARYNRWMNRKLYACASGLEDAERKRNRGAFFASVQGTLNHILLGDRAWMLRFTGAQDRFVSRTAAGDVIAVTSLAQELYDDFEVLHRERERTDEDILTWVYDLDDAALDRTLRYRTTSGDHYDHPLWWALGHFFNHQTHHRGQLTTLLSQAGVDPGVTDLVFMLREESVASI